MSKEDINFCNCNDCKYEQICCSSDGWMIGLTADEVKRFPHTRTPTGQFSIASGPDGYCIYRDPETGKCRTYDDRPFVCKRFSCQGKEEEMTKLLEKHKEIRKNLDAKFSGFFVAFIFKTEKQKMASSMMIRDLESGSEKQLMPAQVFGESEEDVKEKMAELLKKPFRKEDI